MFHELNRKKFFFKSSLSQLEKEFYSNYFKLYYYKEFGYKSLLNRDEQFLELKINSKSPFVNKSKVYLNFWTKKLDTGIVKNDKFVKFSNLEFLEFDKEFRKCILTKKTKQVQKSFFKSIFTKKDKWKSFSWLWKLVCFLNENFIFSSKKSNDNLSKGLNLIF